MPLEIGFMTKVRRTLYDLLREREPARCYEL